MTVAHDPSPLAKILQLHRGRPVPWVGDNLSPEDERRSFHALTSMALAFALYADIDADLLPDLMLAALDAQKDLAGAEGIDEGTLAVLDAVGFQW